MMETANDSFQIVGQRPAPERTARLPKKWLEGKPLISIMILAAIILGCLCAELIMTKDPTYMDLQNYNQAPNREFLFERIPWGGIFFPCSGTAAGFP